MMLAEIFGHSHVWSVRRALREGWTHPEASITAPICGTKELPSGLVMTDDLGKTVLNPIVTALLHRIIAGPELARTWLVSMTQGNFYNQFGMVVPGAGFDFVLDSHPDLPLDDQAVLLPCGAVHEALARQMQAMATGAAMLGRQPLEGRVILIGPPPPPRDEAQIAKLLAAQGGADDGVRISAAMTRLKLWHLQNTISARICAEAGVHYLAGDLPGVQDEDGFLRPEFIKDAVHANHGHAAHLLNEIAAIMTQAGDPT